MWNSGEMTIGKTHPSLISRRENHPMQCSKQSSKHSAVWTQNISIWVMKKFLSSAIWINVTLWHRILNVPSKNLKKIIEGEKLYGQRIIKNWWKIKRNRNTAFEQCFSSTIQSDWQNMQIQPSKKNMLSRMYHEFVCILSILWNKNPNKVSNKNITWKFK